MRTGKQLLQASKAFTEENKLRSWIETSVTFLLTIALFIITLSDIHLIFRVLAILLCGLSYVRLFVIYHDYQHRAILKDSAVASFLMNAAGLYLLAPHNVWSRTHEHHHNNNSKLTIAGIGSYPTVSTERFLALSRNEQRVYLLHRHPLTIIFGYFTVFIFWLNLKSVLQSPSRHLDSLAALLLHIAAATLILYFFGIVTFLLSWVIPFTIAFGIGSYLFYCQHNFPTAKFLENQDWNYVDATLKSTSFMEMNPVMHWFTCNIGYHQVHHLNSRIPFYRLPEALESFPELKDVPTTSWHLRDVIGCFRMKLWDPERDKMVSLSEFRASRAL
jgi:omega-6 fatty acid desaturase (delta-12 desaturase)